VKFDLLFVTYLVAVGACLLVFLVFANARRTAFSRNDKTAAGRSSLARAGNLAAAATIANFYFAASNRNWIGVLVAIALFCLSIVLFRRALAAFDGLKPGIAYTTSPPDILVFKGPYSSVRHPIYLAYIMAWMGAFGLAPTLLSVGILFGMVILYYRAATFEESLILSSAVSDQYEKYRKDTAMIIPRFSKLFKR
jgi:protein-S-isoprenylcysteine O-methyltransferase Ste14